MQGNGKQIELAVSALSWVELQKFARWFEEYFADAWDRQIEANILAGKLDAFAREALDDFKVGRCRPF